MTFFKVATFNIQRGYYQSILLQDFKRLIEKEPEDIPHILLLQEVPYEENGESVFLKKLQMLLGNDFEVLKALSSTHYRGIRDGIAIFHRKGFERVEYEVLPLPQYTRVPWTERVLKKGRIVPEEKIIQLVTFKKDNHTIRIGNIHVDCYGGVNHQSEQVRLCIEHLKKSKAEVMIVGGDFNTKRHPGQKGFPKGYPKMEEALRQAGLKQLDQAKETLKVATPFPGPHEPIGLLQKWLAFFHLNVWAQKTDFIFGSAELAVLNSKILPITGSDHLPVMATVLIE